MQELNAAAIQLGFPFRNAAELQAKFNEIDTNGNGKISEMEFVEWWNKARKRARSRRLRPNLRLGKAARGVRQRAVEVRSEIAMLVMRAAASACRRATLDQIWVGLHC